MCSDLMYKRRKSVYIRLEDSSISYNGSGIFQRSPGKNQSGVVVVDET